MVTRLGSTMDFKSQLDRRIPLIHKQRQMSLWIWGLPSLGVGLAHLMTVDASPVIRMLMITLLLFLGMKVVVLSCANMGHGLKDRNLAWFMFWPGMRPSLFYFQSPIKSADEFVLLREGSIYFILGCCFLGLSHLELPVLLRMLFVMMGWSLVLHFGLFNLLTVFYQRQGWRVRQPFFKPWKASGLGDFWSQRWNRIFSEMLSQSVLRPVVDRFGHSWGILSVFVVSGLLHEAAITLPVQTGYGGPFCYFLIQGILVLLERVKVEKTLKFSGARLFLCVLLPLPLLFPEAFVREVLLPLAGVSL
jgi:hypothetical protein